MKLHYERIKGSGKFRCGKKEAFNIKGTQDIKDVTCNSCNEAYKYDKGLSNKYSDGGAFSPSKDGENWSYRVKQKRLVEDLRVCKGFIEKVITKTRSTELKKEANKVLTEVFK